MSGSSYGCYQPAVQHYIPRPWQEHLRFRRCPRVRRGALAVNPEAPQPSTLNDLETDLSRQ